MPQPKPQYNEPSFKSPWRGWNTQAPENLIPPSDFSNITNFIIRNSEVRTAPRFTPVIPHLAESFPIRGLTTFLDSNNVTHTVSFTNNNFYQLLYNADQRIWNWNRIGSFKTDGNDAPFCYLKFLNKIYWSCNRSLGVFYWDGISNNILEATSGKIGGAFMGELGFNLILLNTLEYDSVTGKTLSYPQRIRWTPSGLPNQWNPVADPGAGYNDQLDVPDFITGFMTLGRAGFIFRTNGISTMTLTGKYEVPFRFDHLWAGERGIGNVVPQSIASYGGTGVFISEEEIYKITVSSFEPIGMGARDKIMEDLDNARGNTFANIVPGYHRKFIYLTYHLFIPQSDRTVVWIYHIEDKTWIRRELMDIVPTSKIQNVSVI